MPRFEISGLFPIPFMRIERLFDADEVECFAASILSGPLEANDKCPQLKHTTLDLETGERWGSVAERMTPYLERFGEALFGERLSWSIKELWGNVMEPGGHQGVHAHANSFISGIVFLSPQHASARTVFHKSLGGREFDFANTNDRVTLSQYNADKWVAPELAPGSAVLYPSYLLHEVPVNQGERRMTLALNAIPDRLDSWGYRLRFLSDRST